VLGVGRVINCNLNGDRIPQKIGRDALPARLYTPSEQKEPI
jgi:hypothetical protein